jgi:tetratricopeptide (TPR) repeat protein
LLGYDTGEAFHWVRLGIEQSRAHGFDFTLAIGLIFEGMLLAGAGNPVEAEPRYAEALEIQQRHNDLEGAGMSLGGLAQLAAAGGDTREALDLYRRSLAAFETIGDRGEEARILSEMAWTHLVNGDTAAARGFFFDAVQAHTDIASVRGVGQSLIGLAAAEAAEHRPERAVQIAAAAEVYGQEEGVVIAYSDETPGRGIVEQARASLPSDQLARATELGRRLTIEEALDLAGPARVAAV